MSSRRSMLRRLPCLPVAGLLLILSPASVLAAGPPVVEHEFATAVGVDSATLNAQIYPSESETTYHFEYGPNTSYGTSVPVPDGVVGAGGELVTVSQIVPGLAPGTTYHYRVVAANAEGVAHGPDLALRTFSPLTSSVDRCSNALLRGAQSAQFLPDCRAYEMVSPVDKRGGNIAASPSKTRIAADGNAIQYASGAGFADAFGSSGVETDYIAERGSERWDTHAISPPQEPPPVPLFFPRWEGDFSPDLSRGVFLATSPLEGNVVFDDPNVHNLYNLYLRTDLTSSGAGQYSLVTGCPACSEPIPSEGAKYLIPPLEPQMDGASSDFSHVFFETRHNLTADAQGEGVKLYEWDNGTVNLAGILPDSACESPPCVAEESAAGRGSVAIPGSATRQWRTYTSSAISENGARVVFTGPPMVLASEVIMNAYHESGRPVDEGDVDGVGGNLYLRESGKTVQINVSERSTPDPNGPQPAVFEGASRDDSKIFFITAQALTDEDTETNPQLGAALVDLYMYDVNAPAGHHLTLLSKEVSTGGNGYFAVQKATAVVGVSEDGSYVYFTAPSNSGLEYRRLYVWHEGVLREVASDYLLGVLVNNEVGWVRDTGGDIGGSEFRVTPDGRHVVFGMRDPKAANYTNYSPHCPEPGCEEVYLYSYDSNKVTCVSCDSTGESPLGDAHIMSQSEDTTMILLTKHMNRVMSDDGSKVFFDTPDPLVAADTNGKRDAYEYDAESGEVHLVSSGRSSADSFFIETDPSGNDVMFTTSEQLVRADIDGNWDLYDARVNGGIPAQNAAAAAPCESDDCQGPAKAAPAFSLPSSLTFAGPGDTAQAPSTKANRRRSKRVTSAQKLARALRACRRKRGRRRRRCEAVARRRYRTARSRSHVSSRRGS